MVSVDYRCASQSAVISWTAVFGATAYRVTAISRSGAILSCTSNSTKCQLRNLTCGENYRVQATALSNNCESTSDATTFLQTGEMLEQNNLQPLFLTFIFHNFTRETNLKKNQHFASIVVCVLDIYTALLIVNALYSSLMFKDTRSNIEKSRFP